MSKQKTLIFLSLFIGTYLLGFHSKSIFTNLTSLFQSEKTRVPIPSEYRERPCPKSPHIGIAYFGQSNSTNAVYPPAKLDYPSNLIQFDWKSKKCFDYQEPLLGASGTGGNSITFMAQKIAGSNNLPVVVIPFGIGGTSVLDWSYGYLSHQHDIVLSHLKETGITPQIFFWHQGESDSHANDIQGKDLALVPYFKFPNPHIFQLGLNENTYQNALRQVVQKTLTAFPKSKFGIALVSRCKNRETFHQIRQAQSNIAATNSNAFISADSDQIFGNDKRYDDCHFSSVGAEILSNEYLKSSSKYLLP